MWLTTWQGGGYNVRISSDTKQNSNVTGHKCNCLPESACLKISVLYLFLSRFWRQCSIELQLLEIQNQSTFWCFLCNLSSLNTLMIISLLLVFWDFIKIWLFFFVLFCFVLPVTVLDLLMWILHCLEFSYSIFVSFCYIFSFISLEI